MENPKRKYKKREKEKTVTVTHHLNTRLKSKLIDGEACFPLYIIVYHNGQTTNVKSRLEKYVSQADFEHFKQQFSDEIEKESKSIIEGITSNNISEHPVKSSDFLQSLPKTTYRSTNRDKAYKPTPTQVRDSNAISYQQLLVEVKRERPNIKDVYYSDHEGVWCIQYNDNKEDSEHESAYEALCEILGI